VVSYDIPGKSGGGDISGFDESDRFIMKAELVTIKLG
jgi:hypothetical protein